MTKPAGPGILSEVLLLFASFLPALGVDGMAGAETMRPAVTGSLHLFQIAVGFLGGVALFLFGMQHMTDALRVMQGEKMRQILSHLTTNRFSAALSGAFATAVTQSSTVTTVLTVGFVSAGIMTLTQSIGVLMGAHVGTTITAQIVAFRVTNAAMFMIAAGFGISFFFKRRATRQVGAAILGLGLMFFGLNLVREATGPLRGYPPFLEFMEVVSNPVAGILAGTICAALLQSSAATIGIAMVLAGHGLMSLEAGIAVTFGANIGTGVTALLSSIGKSRDAQRAAIVNIFISVFGVVIWAWFIGDVSSFIHWISAGAGPTREIANTHTLFNAANIVILIGFTPQLARLIRWMVPDLPLEKENVIRPKYLDPEMLENPSLALDRVRLEIARVGEVVRRMLAESLSAVFTGTHEDLSAVSRRDDEVDILHHEIVAYLGDIQLDSLSNRQKQDFVDLLAIVNDLENIGDIIQTNLVALGYRRIEENAVVSGPVRDVISEVHKAVMSSLEKAVGAVTRRDQSAALEVIAMKQSINALVESAAVHEARNLAAKEPNRVLSYTTSMEFIEDLKHAYYFTKRIAKTAISHDLLEKKI